MISFKIKTPCIGICSTTSLGDPVCRGCKRFSFEVINWNTYQDEEKLAVLDRLEILLTQIFSERFHVRNPQLLQAALNAAAIPFDEQRSPYCWLHNFLKKHHRSITDLQPCGVEVRDAYRNVPLAKLIEQADEELLILSDAHFDRYFALAVDSGF